MTDYSDWVTALGAVLVIPITDANSATPSSDTNFNNVLLRGRDYAENRMQTDLDLLATYTTSTVNSTAANNRVFTLPTANGAYQVVTQVAPIVSLIRQPPMLPLAREALEAMYPSDTAPQVPSVPSFWSIRDATTILVAPAPDAAYRLEVVGTQSVTPLSNANTSNFLTDNLPAMYLAASLIWFFGYQRDFGGQSDDPAAAMSWEQTYQKLLSSATVTNARSLWRGQGWGSRQPFPITTPPQT